jgi:hypothetical protein
MRKDTVYTMRMNKRIRDALGKAALKERRTVASLLDKIITDHLMREGFLSDQEIGAERRVHARKKLTLPVRTTMKTEAGDESFWGVLMDISRGGVLVTYPKGSPIRFGSTGEMPHFGMCLELPRDDEELCFDCKACHLSDTGKDIQIGAAFSNPEASELERMETYLM